MMINTLLNKNVTVEKSNLARWQQVYKDYCQLCKIKVVALLLLTALVGVVLAPATDRSLWLQCLTLLGIGLLASSAAVVNHLVDSDIDAKMARTKNRPVVKGRVSPLHAFIFSLVMALLGTLLLLVAANLLTAGLTLFALVGYAFIYTLYLKRATPQNIVIGGFAGAMPPLLGWVSETGQLAAEPWILVMIIFTWTPPHFWALAIHRKADYERANIPMLPVTHGIEFSKTCVLLYSVLMSLVCVLPYLINMSGIVYLISVMLLNSLFIYKAIKLKLTPGTDGAFDLFKFSIIQLMLLFIALFLDQALMV